jgi:mono/diheme cytochrome c family protein
MLFALGLVAYVIRSVSLRSLEGGVLVLASLVVLGLGAYLAIQAQAVAGSAAFATQVTNPFPPTQDSLATGERVYRDLCQACHGFAGRGDGPAGLALQPPPADFRIHMAAGHTDAQLFGWLSGGVQGTAMPAFESRLTVEERWHVLNFLRTFAQN